MIWERKKKKKKKKKKDDSIVAIIRRWVQSSFPRRGEVFLLLVTIGDAAIWENVSLTNSSFGFACIALMQDTLPSRDGAPFSPKEICKISGCCSGCLNLESLQQTDWLAWCEHSSGRGTQ
jgi:hypothetical protein